MSPILSLPNIGDGRFSDAVFTCGIAMRLFPEQDFSDLGFGKDGSIVTSPSLGCSVLVSVFGVVEMSADVEMVDVDALDVSTNDMSDDLAFRDATFVPNPYEARHESFSPLPVNDEDRSFLSGVSAGPFYTARLSRRTTKESNAFQQRSAAGPFISEAGEVVAGQVVEGFHSTSLSRFGDTGNHSLGDAGGVSHRRTTTQGVTGLFPCPVTP